MLFQDVRGAAFRGPRQFRQVVHLARTGPLALAMEAADNLPCWPAPGVSGAAARPAAVRAARVLDAAMDAAARERQRDIARAAMRDQFEADDDRDLSDFYNRERLLTHLIERAARDTAEHKSEESTRITPDDLVDLVAEFVPIDDREEALFEAEQALRDHHTGWREPTPEEAAEAVEAEAGIDLWLAEHARRSDPFDAAQRPVHPPVEPAREAAFRRAADEAAMRCLRAMAEVADKRGDATALAGIQAEIERFNRSTNLERSVAVEVKAFDIAAEPGLLGDIARWSQRFAFRPVKEFAQPAALATLAAVFGRRWATPTGLGLNLYIVAIGETGGGKDALLGAPKKLLADAGFRHLLGPGDFSSDAAIELSLRARPSQLMPLDEFGKLAQAMMGRNAPSFARLAAKALLEVYPRSQPGSEWTGKQRASDERDNASEPIHSPTLSLLAVSTPEGFFEGMSQQTLDDGFLNRLTVVRAGIAGARQRDPARLSPPPALVEALRAVSEAATAAGNLSGAASRMANAAPPMQFARWADDAAIAAIETVEAWEDDAADAGRRGVAGRAAEQTQKIATLRALSRNPADPAVTATDIQWAFEVVRTSIATIEAGAREMMAGSEFEEIVKDVERAVIAAGDEGIKWSDLLRAKGVSKRDDRAVEAAVKRLEAVEKVWVIIGGRGGRRVRCRRPDERGEY